MQIIVQGLRITTQCRYVKFTEAKYLNIYEDGDTSCLYIEFPRGFSSGHIVDKRIEVLSPLELHEEDYIKVKNPVFNLNGLKFTKLSTRPYTFSQFIVGNLDRFIMNYDEYHCEILIPESLLWSTDKYKCLITKNPYLKILDCKGLKDLRTFNAIRLLDNDFNLKSDNKFIFQTKAKYEKYLLSMIDVQESFITKLERRVKDYGLELLSLPIDQYKKNVSRVTYRFTDLSRQLNYKSDSNPLRFMTLQSAHIDFKLSTPDLVIYNDFINRYQNLDLLTNFTEFYTEDKLGRNWISSIWWSPIDTSFNQDYAVDEQNNVAHEAGFSCDVNYQIVYDQRYRDIQQSIMEVLAMAETQSKIEYKEENVINTIILDTIVEVL
jgi:hypothetical protein